jgi:hypothetical protein
LVGGVPARGAIGVGFGALSLDGTASEKGFAGMASSPGKPAARALFPLRSDRDVGLASEPEAGANGLSTGRARLVITPGEGEAPK